MLQTVKMSDNSGPETSPKSTSPAAGGTTTPPNPATAGAAGTGQPSPPSAKPPWPNHADDYEVKGQLISECIFDALNFQKKTTKIVSKFMFKNLKSG